MMSRRPTALALVLGLIVAGRWSPALAEPEPVEPAPPEQPGPPPPQPPAPPGQPVPTQPGHPSAAAGAQPHGAQPYGHQDPGGSVYGPQPYPPPVLSPSVYPPPPYGSIVGVGLRIGTIVPLGDGYAGAPGAGLLLDLSFWYETRWFAIEPRLGVRFDLVRGPDSYVELPLDVGGYFLFGGGAVAGFAGAGIGARHIWETRGEDIVIGSILPALTELRADDSAWGFGAFGRAGLIFARRGRQRIILSVEYNVTVVELNGFANPTSITAGVGFVL